MSDYPRTGDGFKQAHNDALWAAKFHNKPFMLFVSKRSPDRYSVSIPSIVKEDDIELGTAANLVMPNGEWVPAFGNSVEKDK